MVENIEKSELETMLKKCPYFTALKKKLCDSKIELLSIELSWVEAVKTLCHNFRDNVHGENVIVKFYRKFR